MWRLQVDAKSKEIETEDHLRMLAQREGGRLVQELKRIETEKAELQERLQSELSRLTAEARHC